MTRKRGRHASPAKAPAPATMSAAATRSLPAGPVVAAPARAEVTGSAAKTSSMRSAMADVTLPDIGSVAAFVQDETVVRRTKYGWRVGSEDLPDLTCAMILADLLAAENGITQAPPPKPDTQAVASEAGRLRTTVSQLEHALATRIRVEQAIGVLAERHRIKPRQAFEQLREAARSRGRKVFDIAGDVVASATNPLLQLPDELSRPRSAPRRGVRPPDAQPSGAR
jgi:hypothetical protein